MKILLSLTISLLARMVVGQDIFSFGSLDYVFSSGPSSYADAKTSCTNMGDGAALAVVYNVTLFNSLSEFIRNMSNTLDSFWIGLRRENDSLIWSDGSSLESSIDATSGRRYPPWGAGEPSVTISNSGNPENCIIMGHPCCRTINILNWFDVTCNGSIGPSLPRYICQIPKSTMISSTLTPTTSASTASMSEIHTEPETDASSTTSSASTTTTTSTTQTAAAFGVTTNAGEIPLTIVLPVVIVAFLAVLALIFIALCYRKKCFERTKRKAHQANNGMMEAAAYQAVSPEINQTNFYEIPLPLNGKESLETSATKENSRSPSFYSHPDSFDDDITQDGVSVDFNREIEEGTYCSVGEFDDPEPAAAAQEYVPFSVLESKEDHTYSVPEPLLPALPAAPGQNAYDALASIS